MKLVCAALATLFITQLACPQEQKAKATPGRALLVGASRYPNLPEKKQLRGPQHDVQLIRELCIETLGLDSANIQIVADVVPPNGAAATIPASKANIEAGLAALVDGAQEGELVVVFLAGHGTQIADDNRDEADAKDEAFLPSDVSRFDKMAGECPNAIRDDELRGWLVKILEKNARVWLIVDACHSADLARGEEDAGRVRSLTPEDLGIPSGAGGRALGAGRVQEDSAREPADFGRQFVATYAVSSRDEVTEQRWGGSDVHGLLTWQLVRQLERSGAGISFSELHRRITRGYRSLASVRSHLKPYSEGAVNQQVVSGAPVGFRMDLEYLVGGRMVLQAGLLHDTAVGDQIDFYEPGRRGKSDARIGTVRVEEVHPLWSEVVRVESLPFEESKLFPKGTPAPKRQGIFPARVRSRSPGGNGLRVACFDEVGKPIPQSELPAVLRSVGSASDRGKRFVFEEAGDPDCKVVVRSDGSVSLATAGTVIEGALDQVGQLLDRVAHARLVQSIPDWKNSELLSQRLSFSFWVGNDAKGWREFTPGGSLFPGEGIQLRCASARANDTDLHVSLLCIDSQREVFHCLSNPLKVGRDAHLEQRSSKLWMQDTTVGTEELLILAVSDGGESFDWLETDKIGDLKTRALCRSTALDDLFGTNGTSRGRGANDLWSALISYRMVPWDVLRVAVPLFDHAVAIPEGGARDREGGPPDLGCPRGNLRVRRVAGNWPMTVVEVATDVDDLGVVRFRRYYDLDRDFPLRAEGEVAEAFSKRREGDLSFELLIEFERGADGKFAAVLSAWDRYNSGRFDSVHADIRPGGLASKHWTTVDGNEWVVTRDPQPWLSLKAVAVVAESRVARGLPSTRDWITSRHEIPAKRLHEVYEALAK